MTARRPGSKNKIRMALFVALYFEQPDKSLAAIYREAGYGQNSNDKTAQKEGQQLLAHPWVKQQIEGRKRRLMRRADYGAEKVLTGLIDIADANAGDFAELLTSSDPESVLRSMDPRVSSVIEAIQVQRNDAGVVTKVSVKFYSRLKALELLGQHWGLRFNGRQIVVAGGAQAEGERGSARLALADLLSEMDSAALVQFRDMVERLKRAEQLRLANTVEGEAEEVEDAEEAEAGGEPEAE